MTEEDQSQNFPEKSSTKEDFEPLSDIKTFQEKQVPTVKTPRTLLEWLARINARYLAIQQERDFDDG